MICDTTVTPPHLYFLTCDMNLVVPQVSKPMVENVQNALRIEATEQISITLSARWVTLCFTDGWSVIVQQMKHVHSRFVVTDAADVLHVCC